MAPGTAVAESSLSPQDELVDRLKERLEARKE